MNKNQKIVALSVAAILLAMLLFPPFQHAGSGTLFGFIFIPPHIGLEVNVAQLFIQVLVVSIIGAIMWFVVKD